MDKKVFKKGKVIFSQGRPSDCMYDILKGSWTRKITLSFGR